MQSSPARDFVVGLFVLAGALASYLDEDRQPTAADLARYSLALWDGC